MVRQGAYVHGRRGPEFTIPLRQQVRRRINKYRFSLFFFSPFCFSNYMGFNPDLYISKIRTVKVCYHLPSTKPSKFVAATVQIVAADLLLVACSFWDTADRERSWVLPTVGRRKKKTDSLDSKFWEWAPLQISPSRPIWGRG